MSSLPGVPVQTGQPAGMPAFYTHHQEELNQFSDSGVWKLLEERSHWSIGSEAAFSLVVMSEHVWVFPISHFLVHIQNELSGFFQ